MIAEEGSTTYLEEDGLLELKGSQDAKDVPRGGRRGEGIVDGSRGEGSATNEKRRNAERGLVDNRRGRQEITCGGQLRGELLADRGRDLL
jgi:hypothetical protein